MVWYPKMTINLISVIGITIFFIEIVVIMILVISSGKRWKENRITSIGLLTSLHIIFLVILIIEMIFLLLNVENPAQFYLQDGNLIVSLFPYFGGISAGFYLIFIDYFLNERISPIHSLAYGFFLGALVLNVLFKVMFPEIILFVSQTSFIEIQSLYTIILFFLRILISTNFPATYFVIYVVIATYWKLSEVKKTTYDRRKKQITFLQLTLLSYYLYPTVIVVTGYMFRNILSPDVTVLLRHIIPHIGVIVGCLMIFSSYIRSPKGFLQFHHIEKLMVVNHAGLPLFSYDFDHIKKKTGIQDELLTSGVFALLSFFSEMIETKRINKIQFQDKIIAIAYQDSFLAILIADDISNFLWNALHSFSRMFTLKYGVNGVNELQDISIVTKSVFDDAEKLIKLAFGFE